MNVFGKEKIMSNKYRLLNGYIVFSGKIRDSLCSAMGS